jgi:dTDP-4-dehydrorhamnose reductase
MKVLITGGNGQLAQALGRLLQDRGKNWETDFKNNKELDVTDFEAVSEILGNNEYAYCINCAAFTHVDKAESDTDLAHQVNVNGARNLALGCHQNSTVLIHISTDFVFDGFQNTPYSEEDVARPLGFYGDTKYKGERAIISNLEEHFILRTSWLYSEYGSNFMKTMMRLGAERDELSVVYDQVGTPTYALDLAAVILHLIEAHSIEYGIYNYSNEGVASWYDFAKAIFEEASIEVNVKPIRSSSYPTPARRPNYSVLDKTKIKEQFSIEVPHWRDSLKQAVKALQEIES